MSGQSRRSCSSSTPGGQRLGSARAAHVHGAADRRGELEHPLEGDNRTLAQGGIRIHERHPLAKHPARVDDRHETAARARSALQLGWTRYPLRIREELDAVVTPGDRRLADLVDGAGQHP